MLLCDYSPSEHPAVAVGPKQFGLWASKQERHKKCPSQGQFPVYPLQAHLEAVGLFEPSGLLCQEGSGKFTSLHLDT